MSMCIHTYIHIAHVVPCLSLEASFGQMPKSADISMLMNYGELQEALDPRAQNLLFDVSSTAYVHNVQPHLMTNRPAQLMVDWRLLEAFFLVHYLLSRVAELVAGPINKFPSNFTLHESSDFFFFFGWPRAPASSFQLITELRLIVSLAFLLANSQPVKKLAGQLAY